MPLNPEIPLSVRPFKGPDILATQEYLLRQAQERRMAEQDEFERQKFALARQEMADRAAAQKTIGEAFKGATGPEGIDRSKLMQQVMATQPQLWPTIATELDKADQASLNMRKTRAEIARLEREEEDHKNEGLSRLGFAVEQAGNTPEAWSWLADSAKRKGWASDEDLAPYEQAISQDPTKIASVTAALKSYGMRPTNIAAQAGKTREVRVWNPEKQQEEIQIVEDKPGQAFPVAPKTAPGEAKVGTFEDYVLRVAAEKGKKPEQLTTAEIESARKKYQQADDRPAVTLRMPSGMTPGQEFTAVRQLRNDFNRETTAARTVQQQLALMKSSLDAVKKGSAPAGSQGVLVTFQKILDPTSVVRESEYARSASGLSLLGRIDGYKMKIMEGGAGVTVGDLQNFVNLAEQFAKNQNAFAEQSRRQIDSMAKRYGLHPEDITRDITPPELSAPAPGAGGVDPDLEAYRRRKAANK